MPIQFLFLHALELVDAVQVLLAEAVVIPAHAQTRALFEAVIQLEWLLREATARRAFAYQFFDLRERIRFCRSLIPTTQDGKELTAALKKGVWAIGMTLPQHREPEKKIANLERLLTKPAYGAADAEYEKMPKSGEQAPKLVRTLRRPPKYSAACRARRTLDAL